MGWFVRQGLEGEAVERLAAKLLGAPRVLLGRCAVGVRLGFG